RHPAATAMVDPRRHRLHGDTRRGASGHGRFESTAAIATGARNAVGPDRDQPVLWRHHGPLVHAEPADRAVGAIAPPLSAVHCRESDRGAGRLLYLSRLRVEGGAAVRAGIGA